MCNPEPQLGVVYPGVILSPAGQRCVSNEDADLIRSKGLAVVDCSWNRLADVPFGECLLREGHMCYSLAGWLRRIDGAHASMVGRLVVGH